MSIIKIQGVIRQTVSPRYYLKITVLNGQLGGYFFDAKIMTVISTRVIIM